MSTAGGPRSDQHRRASTAPPALHRSSKTSSKTSTLLGVNGMAHTSLPTELLRMRAEGLIDPLEETGASGGLKENGWSSVAPAVGSGRVLKVLEPVDVKQEAAQKLFNKRPRVESKHSRGYSRRPTPHMVPTPPASLYQWNLSEFASTQTLAAIGSQLEFPPEQVLGRRGNELSMEFGQTKVSTTEEVRTERIVYYPKKLPQAYRMELVKKDKLFRIAGRSCWMSQELQELLSSEACVVARGGLDPFRDAIARHRDNGTGVEDSGSAGCVDIILELLDGDARSSCVSDASRFKLVHVDDSDEKSSPEPNTASSFDGRVPNVLVGFDSDWLSVSAELLNAWEHAHFEPYVKSNTKPLSYITIRLCRSSPYDSCCHDKHSAAIDSYLKDIAAMYEDCCQQTLLDIGEGGIDLCGKDAEETRREDFVVVAGVEEAGQGLATFEGLKYCQEYTQSWLSTLRQLKSTKLFWLVLPIESRGWVPFLMDAIGSAIKTLKDAGIAAQFQVVHGESVLPWRRNKSDMHSIVSSLFTKCNSFDSHSELVVLDSENTSKGANSGDKSLEEEGEITDSDDDLLSEEESANIQPSVHACCSYSNDGQWLAVAWTDESGSFLQCESYQTEDMAVVTVAVVEKCLKHSTPKTSSVVVALVGGGQHAHASVWKSAVENASFNKKQPHLQICAVVPGKVNVPGDLAKGSGLYRVVATRDSTQPDAESILYASSMPCGKDTKATLWPEVEDQTISVLHVKRLHNHPRSGQGQQLTLEEVIQQFQRLAWLSRGAFNDGPLTCVPLHMSCAARLAYWLNGSSMRL